MKASRPGALLLDGGDTWQGSATSLWTNAQDMVDACKLLGVDVMTRALGDDVRPEARAGDRREGLQGQDRLRRPERQDHRLRRPGVRAVHDEGDERRQGRGHRAGLPVHADRQPALHGSGLELRHPGRQHAEGRRRGARQGRAGRRGAVAQRHGRRPQDGLARARHRRDPRRPHARRRAGAEPGQERRRHHAGDQRRQQRQVPRRARLRREERQDRRLPLQAAAGLLEPAARGQGDGRVHQEGARAVRGQAQREARGHRRPALSPRQLQRHVRPGDLRRADAGEGRRHRVLARASAGARRCCPARRS